MERIDVKNLLICPVCKKNLPCNCGYKIQVKDNIIQLTDLPNMNIEENEQDKYIGYERIGKNFSGYDGEYIIDEYFMKASKLIKEEVKDGLLLDLGCGDGLFAIPLIMNGVRVIAGDISNNMMMIMQEKLEKLNLDSSMIKLVRINAYDIPISDNSVDAVIANSMLHLNSNPEKIIKEIYRVLKPKGKFICFDDKPGGDDDHHFNNKEYGDRLEFHKRYFDYLKELNIYPRRYSWKFNRDKVCDEIFSSSYELCLDIPITIEKTTFYDGFYKRMKGKGFSDQSAVPDDIHNMIFDKVDNELKEKYGENYTNAVLTYYTTQKYMKVYLK